MGGYKEVSAKKISFDTKGQQVEGNLISADDTSYEGNHMFNMETENGEMVKFLGTSAIENILMRNLGQKVRLTYKGTLKTRNGTMKDITVEVWQD